MIIYDGKKLTPTQLAKIIVADKVQVAEEYWAEDMFLEADNLTDREKEQIQDAINKQGDRVYKLLNYWELRRDALGYK